MDAARSSERRDRRDAISEAEPDVPAHPLTRWTILIFAVTCGVSVANIYYAQPLLGAMAASFGIKAATIGIIVTLTQIGYAAGLVFIVPIGDLVNRRKLILGQILLSVIALVLVASAPTAIVLFAAMIAMGLLAVVVQVLVALTATLAKPEERGQAVGSVTSGIVIGILLARLMAGVVADLGGWRAVYFLSAGMMLVSGLVLIRILPRDIPVTSSERYGAAVKSIPGLLREEPLLRARTTFAFLIFASFSTLWTAMVLPLSAEPYAMSHTEVGLFGLAGLAGALAAGGAGRLADRGLARWTTGSALGLLTFSWLPLGLLPYSLIAFAMGVVLLDLGVQAVHVTNQSLIFAIRPEARSRLVGAYMVFYSAGSALGAISSTLVYAQCGWTGVCLLGFAYSFAALIFWAVKR